MGADYLSYVKTNESQARAFLALSILAIGRVAAFFAVPHIIYLLTN
jgi:hypothetical protein